MPDELQKKMDNYNEMLLKSTALTFSSEGVSNDIKAFLSRKAVFVNDMMNGMASLIDASSKGRITPTRRKLFDEMIEHALYEARMVNSTMNYVIAKTFEREASFVPVIPNADEPTPEKNEDGKKKRVKK